MKHIKFILVLFALIFTSCSKNEGFAPSLADNLTDLKPGSISYLNSSPTYVVNTTITNNIPTVTGGGPIESWSITPDLATSTGLTFNTTTGVISGTATIVSHPGLAYTITATNSHGTSTVSLTITTNTNGVAPTISYSGTYTYHAGQTLTSPITPSLGGGNPTSCTSSPALPTGLVLDATTCVISGTPTATAAQQLFTITATNAAGSGSGTVNIGVIAVGADNIALTGVPSFTTSTCALFNLTTRDTFGNATQVLANTTFSLSGAGTNGAFYSDASCTSSISNIVVASGSSGAAFYYRKTSTGSTTLSATLTSPASPALGSATRSVTVGNSTPAKYGVVIPTTGTTVSCNAVTINVLDASDNVVSATSSTTVNVSGTASAVIFRDATCSTSASSLTIASGSSSVIGYMRKTSAGASTVTASSVGMASGSGVITISVAPAQRLIFSSSAAVPYAASTCQSYTLQSRDSLNNNASAVTTDTTITLSGVSDGSFYSNSTCTAAITTTTMTSGTSTRTIYFSKPTSTAAAPGSQITLSADVTGWSPTATTVVSVSTGNTINLGTANTAVGIAVSTASAVTAANKCLLTTVRVQDELNALVPASKVTSPITANLSGGGAGAQFWSNSTCTTPTTTVTINAGSNTGNFYYSNAQTTATVPINWSNGGLGGNGGSRNVTVSDGIPSRMTWTTGSTAFNTNTCQTYTVNVRDPNTVTAIGANVSSATDFQLSDGSDGQFFSTAGCTNPISTIQIASGAQTATFYYRKATASTATITVDLQSPLNPTIATLTRAVTVSLPAPVPNNILISATPGTSLVATQSCSALTLQSRNGSTLANVTSNSTFTLSGTNGAQFYYDSGCTAAATPSLTIANGTNSISGLYVKTANVGNVVLSGSGPITVNNLTLTYSAPTPTRLDLSGPILMNATSSCGSYAVTTQDALGVDRNVSSNTAVTLSSTGSAAVQFFSDSACTTALPSNRVTVTSGTSRATFYVRGDSAGDAEVQSSASGLTSATYSVTIQ